MSPASLLYPEHLYGADSITETVFGLEFSISPRAHFAINTYGAEILFETISQILGTGTIDGAVPTLKSYGSGSDF
jgi:hypothetical protein